MPSSSSFLARWFPPWLRNPWGGLVLAAGAYSLLVLAALAFQWGGESAGALLANLAPLPVLILTALGALQVARQIMLPPQLRQAWLLIGLAVFAYLLADLIWLYLESALGKPPFPSLADGFYLLFYPLMFVGILRFPTVPGAQRAQWNSLLYIACVVIAATMYIGHFVLLPTLAANAEEPWTAALASLYPLGDLVLIGGAVLVSYRRVETDTRAALLLLLSGLGLFVLLDVGFAYLTLFDLYPDQRWLDAGWVAAFALFFGAAVRQMHTATPDARDSAGKLLERVGAVQPYLALVSAYWLAASVVWTTGLTATAGWLVAGALTLTALVVMTWLLRTAREEATEKAAPGAAGGASEARNAVRAALVAAAVTGGLTVFYGARASWQTGDNSEAAALQALGMLLANLGGAWLSRRGQHVAGTWLVLGGFMAGALAVQGVHSGLGLTFLISTPLIVAVVAGQTLPARHIPWAVGLGLAVGAAAAVLDAFWPWPRPQSPIFQTLPFIVTGVVLVLGWEIVRRFPGYRLVVKLLISFVVVVILAVGAQSVVLNLLLASQIREQVGRSLATVAENTAIAIGDEISLHVSVLRTLSLNNFVQYILQTASRKQPLSEAELRAADERWRAAVKAGQTGDPILAEVLNHPLSDELRELRRLFPDLNLYLVTDRYGVTVAATEATEHLYHGDDAWWRTAYQRGVYIGLIEEGVHGLQLGLAVAVFAPEREQTTIGVALALFDANLLADTLAGARLGQTGRAEIYFEDGRKLELHEAADGRLALKLEEARLDIEELTQASAPYLEIEPDDVPTFSGLALIRPAAEAGPGQVRAEAVADLGWWVVISQDQAEALEPLNTAARSTLLITIGALFFAGLAATVVARLLTRPLARLTAVAARVSGGDLKAQAPVESSDEIGALATTFNVMTTQLRETLEGLEQRVADRTRALAASAEVSRRLSTLLDPAELVKQVVEEVQRSFGYYHAHIYLFDEARENLVMVGGTGEAGALMLARGHKLPRGKGLVGRAAETNQIVLVPETALDPGWLPNPLLPETKAEIAVPIALGEQVLGVLDVQHNIVGGLTQDNADLLQAIANQTAIALQNAHSYRQVQRQAEVEALVNTISQKIQATATVDEALQVTAREVGRALGGRRTQVRLAPTNGHVESPANTARSQN